MRAENYIKIEFPSRSVNEGFARAAAAAFAASSLHRASRASMSGRV